MANLDPSAPILSRQTVSSSTATLRDGQTTIVALLGNPCAMSLQLNTCKYAVLWLAQAYINTDRPDKREGV